MRILVKKRKKVREAWHGTEEEKDFALYKVQGFDTTLKVEEGNMATS